MGSKIGIHPTYLELQKLC